MPKKVCYYCGTELTKENRTKEHIPPKMMFKAFKCDAVTVSACKDHNSSKSGDDQSIISGFIQSLNEAMSRFGTTKFTPNVRKAIAHQSSETVQTTKNMVELHKIEEDLPLIAYVKLPTIKWIRQLSAGWVFDATGVFDASINWDETIVHSPSWFSEEFKDLSKIERVECINEIYKITSDHWESLKWKSGWSPYPYDIYQFFVSFNDSKTIFLKHIFYDSFTWYVQFNCLQSTRQKIKERVRN